MDADALTNSGSPDDGERLEIKVYRQLLDKIRFGTFAIGQKLPSENELATEHGVSRPVIRAALSRLRDSGLIVSRRGAGSFVNSGTPNDSTGFAALGSISDISNYFDFRRLIEARTAELAARHATPADVDTLARIVSEIGDRLEGGEDAVSSDYAFHLSIAQLSDNRFLIETLGMLHLHWVFVGTFLRSLGASGDRTGKPMNDEHRAIVDAIAANDERAARDAMLRHIDGSERRVFRGDK